MSLIGEKGVVHCFFEQSGTFKNEIKKGKLTKKQRINFIKMLVAYLVLTSGG